MTDYCPRCGEGVAITYDFKGRMRCGNPSCMWKEGEQNRNRPKPTLPDGQLRMDQYVRGDNREA